MSKPEREQNLRQAINIDLPSLSSSPSSSSTSSPPPVPSKSGTETLNDNELRSVRALIAYAAFSTDGEVSAILNRIFYRFDIRDLQNLPRDAYDEIIRFLVDMCESANKAA